MGNCKGGCVNNLCACSTVASKPLLTLNDSEFVIGDGADTIGKFNLKDFAFPTDGKQCMQLEIPKSVSGAQWKTLTLFDNEIDINFQASPAETIDDDIALVRGILLKIIYNKEDDNLEEVPLKDKKCFITITNSLNEECTYSLYTFFSIFTNPVTDDPSEFINKIVISNPSTEHSIKVDALLLYAKTSTL